MNLESENKMCCSALSRSGFDGDLLRLDAPKILISLTKPVIKPHTTERLEVIADAKLAGIIFHATRGEHPNSDDYFKS